MAGNGNTPDRVTEPELSKIDERRLERRLEVLYLRKAGMPIRAIASAIGASKNTVMGDLKVLRLLSQNGTVEDFEPEVVTGLNRKRYRSSRSS
jgi:IS30 family transposase